MKTINILKIVILFVLASTLTVKAQSDYEKAQKFKERYTEIENSIRTAQSLEECNDIEVEIDSLESRFKDDKYILDAAMYPETFSTSIMQLKTQLNTRKGDFGQIVELQTQVVELENQIDNLNRRNSALIGEIGALNQSQKKDKETIESLNRLVYNLQKSIRERDELVRDIIDTLFHKYVDKPLTLNDAERADFYRKIESGNLFYNVQRTINDNIQLLNVTEFESADLANLKEKQVEFKHVWNQLGEKIAKVYSEDKRGISDVAHINDLFVDWENRMDEKIWQSVADKFRDNGINLSTFKDGEQFSNVVISFINNELDRIEAKGKEESQKTYAFFADSTYFKSIEPDFMPLLIEYNLISSDQKDRVENKIGEWENKVEPEFFDDILLYGLAAIAILTVLFMFLRARRKK